MKEIKKFTVKFFENLKCDVSKDGDVLVVENVSKSFEDLFGQKSPYRLNFVSAEDGIFVGKGSSILSTMMKFLKGAGKTTLLKIDFDCNAEKEISKVISLKNCEIGNIIKKHKNNFFSRFTFITTFRYLNEAEQVVNEIYVHDGKVVNGDLNGYGIIEGDIDAVKDNRAKEDYNVARGRLKELLKDKNSEIEKTLGEKADVEIERIKEHYNRQIQEIGGDLNERLKKIKEMELALRVADEEDRYVLRLKLERMKKGLAKIGNDEAMERVLKEQEFTIKDAIHKYSLNIDNKLVNTTIIYYPIFSFNLFLHRSGEVKASGEKEASSGRLVEMVYNPLTKKLNNLFCESCGKPVSRINLCSSGHISCDDCLEKCGGCGRPFCKKCLKRSCSVCGKSLCKDCAIMCPSCGEYVCSDHLRKDSVSGEEMCVNCLRACPRCHSLAHPKFFGEALDGSKVCQKCLAEEKRGEVMKDIFGN